MRMVAVHDVIYVGGACALCMSANRRIGVSL